MDLKFLMYIAAINSSDKPEVKQWLTLLATRTEVIDYKKSEARLKMRDLVYRKGLYLGIDRKAIKSR